MHIYMNGSLFSHTSRTLRQSLTYVTCHLVAAYEPIMRSDMGSAADRNAMAAAAGARTDAYMMGRPLFWPQSPNANTKGPPRRKSDVQTKEFKLSRSKPSQSSAGEQASDVDGLALPEPVQVAVEEGCDLAALCA